MAHSKIVFNCDECVRNEKYEIYVKNKYYKQFDKYFKDYIIRLNNGTIFEFIHELEKESDNYTIIEPIQTNYIVHIIDENYFKQSKYNIKLRFIDKILWIHSINYKRGIETYKKELFNEYYFQILCQKYIGDLIQNYSEIFEILFSNKIENYKIKIKRRSEFACFYDENNFEMGFEKYLKYIDEKYPNDDIEEYFVGYNDIIDLTKNNEYVFKYHTMLKSYFKNNINEYQMISLNEINNLNDINLRSDNDNIYLYYNRIEYIISLKKENKNYFIYDDKIICYYGINYKISDIIKLNENTILINVGNYNFNPDSLKEILKLESEDYSKITKYIIGTINNI